MNPETMNSTVILMRLYQHTDAHMLKLQILLELKHQLINTLIFFFILKSSTPLRLWSKKKATSTVPTCIRQGILESLLNTINSMKELNDVSVYIGMQVISYCSTIFLNF